jgi:RHS repeat-associated protein
MFFAIWFCLCSSTLAKYRDIETDLVYYGHRYYTHGTGRWLSQDPLNSHSDIEIRYQLLRTQNATSNNDSLNVYSYVVNQPTHAFDADGASPNALRPLASVKGNPASLCQLTGTLVYTSCWLGIINKENLFGCCYTCHPLNSMLPSWKMSTSDNLGICVSMVSYFPGISSIGPPAPRSSTPCSSCITVATLPVIGGGPKGESCP